MCSCAGCRVRVAPGPPEPATAVAALVQQGNSSQQLPHEAGPGQYAGIDEEAFFPTVAFVHVRDRHGVWYSSTADFKQLTVS